MNIGDDLRSLQRGLRDLVALTTLPAIWMGRQPHEIAESLAEVLLTTLRLNLVYVHLKNIPAGGESFEIARTEATVLVGEHARVIGKAVAPWLKVTPSEESIVIEDLTGKALQIAVLPLGHQANNGFAVAGTYTPTGFTNIDRLLLSVAANQAVIAFQQAQLLADLRAANQQKDKLLTQEQLAREEAQRTTKRIALLQELTATLAQALSLEQITHITLQIGTKLCGCDGGAVYILTEQGQSLWVLDQIKIAKTSLAPAQEFPLEMITPATDAIREKDMRWMENISKFIPPYTYLADIVKNTKLHSLMDIPLLLEDKALGCLEFGFIHPHRMTDDEANLLLAVAQQCVQALERLHLNEQVQMRVVAEERQRLARELHDAVSQALFSSTLIAKSLPMLAKTDPDKAWEHLDELYLLNRGALAEMRNLLLELRPASLRESDIKDLLGQLADAVRGRKKIKITVQIEGNRTLPEELKLTLYRLTQEALNNIVKHAEAKEVTISLLMEPTRVKLHIKDDGNGFDPTHVSTKSLGLRIMHERVASLGGELTIISTIGDGTQLTALWED